MGTPLIDVERLAISYDGRLAVSDVSFSVDKGEAFGLVGESGSGKSSVLRALVGLVPETTGRVLFEGTDATKLGCGQGARRRMQMVFQDPYGSLHPNHAVERVLGEAVDIAGLDRKAERIRAALTAVGLDGTFLGRYPHQMSGGQRQRVAIGRALIVEPDVLLLDEPTSALDVSVQAEILNLLARLRRERRVTTIFVSHDLAVISWFCDRVAVMQGGRIVETATTEAMRRGDLQSSYARELLEASRGYRRVA